MTQDEIVEMAREAGLATTYGGYRDWVEAGPRKHRLVAFAKLVAAKATAEANARANASWTLMCEKMVAMERESIDQLVNDDKELSDNDAIRLSKAIRARGQA
jgi:regulator of sigma D